MKVFVLILKAVVKYLIYANDYVSIHSTHFFPYFFIIDIFLLLLFY